MDYSSALTGDGDGTRIRLRVVPRAGSTGPAGLHGDAIKLRVAAPPSEGRANEAALRWLAAQLGVRRRDLTILTGRRARTKVVRVSGLSLPEVAARLHSRPT